MCLRIQRSRTTVNELHFWYGDWGAGGRQEYDDLTVPAHTVAQDRLGGGRRAAP